MVITGVVEMETVATAVDVHDPVPDKTVQVVVVVGVTVTFATAAGFEPELAVQTYGPPPLTESAWLCPKQIDDKDGVIDIVGELVIETDATAEAVQLPVPTNTE